MTDNTTDDLMDDLMVLQTIAKLTQESLNFKFTMFLIIL